MAEQTAAFKAHHNARQNGWAMLWLLQLQHCDIFLPPSRIFLLCDKFCTLFWLCWHPVSCVQSCFREGTYNRAFLVQVKEAAGSSLLHPAQEEHQTFPLVVGDRDNSKTALNHRFFPWYVVKGLSSNCQQEKTKANPRELGCCWGTSPAVGQVQFMPWICILPKANLFSPCAQPRVMFTSLIYFQTVERFQLCLSGWGSTSQVLKAAITNEK